MSSYLVPRPSRKLRLLLCAVFASGFAVHCAHAATGSSSEDAPFAAVKKLGTSDGKLDDGSKPAWTAASAAAKT